MIQHLNTIPFQIAVVVAHHTSRNGIPIQFHFRTTLKKLQKRALSSNTSN